MRAWFIGRFHPALAADTDAIYAAVTHVEPGGDTRVAEITIAEDGQAWRGHERGARLIVTACACGTSTVVEIPAEVKA